MKLLLCFRCSLPVCLILCVCPEVNAQDIYTVCACVPTYTSFSQHLSLVILTLSERFCSMLISGVWKCVLRDAASENKHELFQLSLKSLVLCVFEVFQLVQ